MNKKKLETAFKKIFPNGDIDLFLHYLKQNKGDVDFSLYSYGEIREGEYKKEKAELKRLLE